MESRSLAKVKHNAKEKPHTNNSAIKILKVDFVIWEFALDEEQSKMDKGALITSNVALDFATCLFQTFKNLASVITIVANQIQSVIPTNIFVFNA